MLDFALLCFGCHPLFIGIVRVLSQFSMGLCVYLYVIVNSMVVSGMQQNSGRGYHGCRTEIRYYGYNYSSFYIVYLHDYIYNSFDYSTVLLTFLPT
jgi:hypothetical protein